MSTRNAAKKATPFEVARHIVSQAHRERVRLRRLGYSRVAPRVAPGPAAAEKGAPLRVVVGVDGSDGSRRALAWAAREAQAHGGRLTVCWVGLAPAAALPGGPDAPASARGSFDRVEEELLAAVAAAAPDLDPEVRLVPAVVGAKTDELTELSRTADLLVLARPYERHLNRQSAASVTRRLVSQAGCPVLLVP